MSRSVLIGLPSLLQGGTEAQTLSLTQALVGSGLQTIILTYFGCERNAALPFENAGVEKLCANLRTSDSLVFICRSLIRLFRHKRPEIVHVQYIAPGLIPIIAARLAGVKAVFATVHQPGRTYGWKAKLFIRVAARLCTVFFCVSRSAEESWFGSSELFDPEKPNRKRKHFTIYNAVDIDRIEKAVMETNKNDLRLSMGISGKRVIGVVGRLRSEKGQSLLIDAMPEIIRKFPDVVLLVVGDGPDREVLRLRAERLKLEKYIIWLGQKSSKEVYKLYSVIELLVVPSRFEGFGLVAAEAMAVGLPIVATKVDGLTEVIEDGVTGILVPSGDSAALAMAITELLADENRSEQMGAKGSQRVLEHFSVKKYNRSILAAYKTFGT